MATIDLFSYADAVLTGPVQPLYEQLAEQAVLADRLGYERLWLTEQHLDARGRVPDSLQMLAFLAGKTQRLRLGTGVLPAAVHDPVLLVESALQLDALSAGRIDLGIGSGSEAGTILTALSVAPEETGARTAALYDLFAQVAPGGRAALPFDPPPGRPLLEAVWTAAGRNAVELTARYGTNLLLPRPMPLPARVELARRYRRAVPDGRVAHFKAGLVGPTTAEAQRRAAPFVQDYARRYLSIEAGEPGTTAFADAIERLDFAVGDPAGVAEHVHRWLRDFERSDVVAVQFAGPGVRQEHVLESMELFAPQLPALR